MLAQNNKLTNLQLEIIKTFSINISDTQVDEIKQLLVNYFAEKATVEMDMLWKKNNWDSNTMYNWLTKKYA